MHETPQNPIGIADDPAMTPEGTPPIGIQGEVEHAPSMGTGRTSKISRATLAMAGLFIVGMAILAALSSGAGPREASASDQAIAQQVESFLSHSRARDGNAGVNEGTRMVASFYHYASRRQIPVDQLNKNPFIRAAFQQIQTPSATKTTMRPKVVTVANSQKRKDLKRDFDRLKLQGIMMTPRGGTAIINDTFVMRGHRLGLFMVAAINEDSVELTCDQLVFTLSLDR